LLAAGPDDQARDPERRELRRERFEHARKARCSRFTVELEHRTARVAIAHKTRQSVAFTVQQAISIGVRRNHACAQLERPCDAGRKQRGVDRLVAQREHAHADRAGIDQARRDEAPLPVEHANLRARHGIIGVDIKGIAKHPRMPGAQRTLERLLQPQRGLLC
jgi:hypothetical protein